MNEPTRPNGDASLFASERIGYIRTAEGKIVPANPDATARFFNTFGSFLKPKSKGITPEIK